MRQWHLQPTCAVTGDGLHEGMERLREMILRRRRQNGRIGGGGGGFLNVKLPLSSRAGAASGARTPTRNKVRRSHSYHH